MALHQWPMAGLAGTSRQLAPIVSEESSEDLDEFEEAHEPSMTLNMSLEDCKVAIAKFFSNDVQGAIGVMTPWKDKSLYHSHGAAVFEFIPAMLTMDPQQIQLALASIKDTFALCQAQRRCYSFVESIGTIIKKHNYGTYSEAQAHAELIYAEALLVQACLLALEGEDLTGLVRATLRIKNSHNSYKDCIKILNKKRNWDNDSSRDHFESGVRMGVATFNVMISMLPPKLISLLEFVGFSGDKEYGLQELLIGARKPGLRSVLCSLTLLVHHLVIGQFAAIPPDYELARTLIDENLAKYTDSAWFLMFKGRLALLLGKPAEAVEIYQLAAKSKGMWPQLIHLAHWETMWAHAMMGQWEQSAHYAACLLKESLWSRTIYAYAVLAASLEQETPPDGEFIEQLIQSATNSRQRILGRSVPMEKFVLRRCERYRSRGLLVLPGTELLCLWNMFSAVSKDRKLADRLLKAVEDQYTKLEDTFVDHIKANGHTSKTIDATKEKLKYDSDDFNLLRHMRGALLLAMGYPRLALEFFDALLNDKDSIKENTYLIPYTLVETAMCHYSLGDTDMALRHLNDARKKSGYPLESRLQFRIHAKTEMIRHELEAKLTSDASNATARTKLVTPATLGTQGNLVVTTPPIPIPEDDDDDVKDSKGRKKDKGKGKDKKDKKEKTKTKSVHFKKVDTVVNITGEVTVVPRPASPEPGPAKRDSMVTTDGVVVIQPQSGDMPLSMTPPKNGRSK